MRLCNEKGMPPGVSYVLNVKEGNSLVCDFSFVLSVKEGNSFVDS